MSGRRSISRSASKKGGGTPSPSSPPKKRAKEDEDGQKRSTPSTQARRKRSRRAESETERTPSPTQSPKKSPRKQPDKRAVKSDSKSPDKTARRTERRGNAKDSDDDFDVKVERDELDEEELDQIKEEEDLDADEDSSVSEMESSLKEEYSDGDDARVVLGAAGLSTVIELGKGTKDRCGRCSGCTREACNECSACKRQDYASCIDTYCAEQEANREQRAAARQLYIESLGGVFDKKTGAVTFSGKRQSMGGEQREAPPSIVVRRDRGGDQRKTNYVYAARASAAKVRRCGECEGCMRDDCGDCAACADKPRFGGKGTKKRACVERVCRMKAATTRRTSADDLEVDLS